MSFDDQIQRIKEKLKTAKTTDDNLYVFGADSHKYQLNSPLSNGKVKKFEKKLKNYFNNDNLVTLN